MRIDKTRNEHSVQMSYACRVMAVHTFNGQDLASVVGNYDRIFQRLGRYGVDSGSSEFLHVLVGLAFGFSFHGVFHKTAGMIPASQGVSGFAEGKGGKAQGDQQMVDYLHMF